MHNIHVLIAYATDIIHKTWDIKYFVLNDI